MTDQELRGKIAEYFAQLGYTTLKQSRGKIGEIVFYAQADAIIAIFEKLGYHKIPSGEPPVLSDDRIATCVKAGYAARESDVDLAIDRRTARAQLASDIAFYTGAMSDQEKAKVLANKLATRNSRRCAPKNKEV